ncbi:MAG: ribonuclease PH, partial [Planctomycetes bacterium]|nr:ribonuclease PH [Planctomycetota bacterium]
GSVVALYDALLWMEEQRLLPKWPLRGLVSAISVGLVNGAPMLDPDYQEDSQAEADLNVVWANDGKLIEVQVGAERRPFSFEQLQAMLAMAQQACAQIRAQQKQVLGI